jgi:protein phosphatase
VLASDELEWCNKGHVFVVADGMGAHAAGELASKLAADNIPHTYLKAHDLPPPQAIIKSILSANELIHGRGRGSVDFQGMGTTCSTLILLPQGALAAHVGDSRIYRLRGDKYEQLTFDHSLVWEMQAQGLIVEGQTGVHVPKNVITRSLGPNAQVKIDLEGPFPVDIGDVYLLCSDGLSGQVTDVEMGTILACLPPKDAVQTLVDLANLRGGPDNITVIVVKVVGPLVTEVGLQAMAAKQAEADVSGPSIAAVAWTCAAGLLALTAGLGYLGKIVAAAITGVVAVIAGGVAYVQKPTTKVPRVLGGYFGQFGKGPYRSYTSAPNAETAGKLAETVDKLQAAATSDGWDIDWKRFNAYRQAGQTALAAHDYRTTVIECSRAIRFMIAELRALREKRAV